jgi:hypothetical protein
VSWLSNYPFRKKLVVAAGVGASTLFQYPVKVYAGAGIDGSETLSGMTGSKVYVDTKCNGDFGNLTFTSSDGVTELSYWQQTITAGVSAVYWVKTPDATANQTLYFYYGAGASKSNQANTFVDVIGGVVGAWNMEEATNTDPVVDYSGNGNNGTPTGTTVVNGYYAGKKARSGDGIGDKITVTSPAAITNLNAFTITWVVKPQTANLDNTNGMFSKTQATGFLIKYYQSSLYSYRRATGLALSQTSDAYTVNNWWRIAMSLDWSGDKKIHLYVNGIEQNYASQTAGSGALSNDAGNFYMLCDEGTAFFKGIMQNLIIVNSALGGTSIDNIADNYPDVSLEAGKVLVRKYATTTNPSHSAWSSEESLALLLEAQAQFASSKQPSLLGPPAPRPTVPNKFIELIRDWLEAKIKVAL